MYPTLFYSAVVIVLFNEFGVKFYRSDQEDLNLRIKESLFMPGFYLSTYLLFVILIYFVCKESNPVIEMVINKEFISSVSTNQPLAEIKYYIVNGRIGLTINNAFNVATMVIAYLYYVFYVSHAMVFYPL